MAYQSSYRSSHRSGRRHRRRRRNSHYGVLIALILLIIIAVPVAVRLVKGVAGAIFGGSSEQMVYQLENTKAYTGGKLVDLNGAAPFADETGAVMVPLKPLCEQLGMKLEWEQVSKTATVTYKKDTARIQADSRTLRFNDETSTMSTAACVHNGAAYVPAADWCSAFSWQVNELSEDQGGLIVISKSKKELSEKKLTKAAEDALEVLGPSRGQLMDGCILMRSGSDKLYTGGETRQMAVEGTRSGLPVAERDGIKYVPLQAAVAALGGTATFDGKDEWSVTCNELDSTVETGGKTKVNGDRVKGDDIKVYEDEETGCFYVSAPLFGALAGRSSTDLGENGIVAFTKMPLDGFDSQKAYLSTLQDSLTESVSVNVPDADVYVALTFDDGPTGATGPYPNGYTATLLDELKKRNVHATFFMCGYRIKDFNSHMTRYIEEGHELGNHTMDHPDARLTHLDAESVRKQVEDNSALIESYTGHRPTVMRPVGGGVNDTVKEQMKALGLPIINWNVDTEDWKTRNDADSVKNRIISQVEDGDIVLMHDIWEGTLPGVLAAIDELQSRTDKTYAFVTVSELAAVKGITLEPGTVYSDLSDETVQAIADGTYKERIFD